MRRKTKKDINKLKYKKVSIKKGDTVMLLKDITNSSDLNGGRRERGYKGLY